jgi:cystathionine beta-lyase/cystathionine gamma-synthase
VLIPDLASVVRAMQGSELGPYLVLDNTGLSCTFQPFQLPLGRRVRALVFESLTKYAQFGLDRVTGGVILSDERDADALDRYREHLGTNIADASVRALPWPDRVRLERRLDRIGRNAVTLAAAIARAAQDTGRRVVVGANHPGLEHHPSYSVARDLSFSGGWLSIAFSPTCDRPEIHRRFVELVIEESRRRQVPLNAGATFGLDVTRIYPTASTALSGRPFVRVSPGIEHLAQIEELAAGFHRAVTRLASEYATTSHVRAG